VNITERIFDLMKKNSITAAQLSKELSLTKSIFTQWKQELQKPSVEAITKIADYFNVSTDYILCKTDDPTPPDKKSSSKPDIKWGDFGISFYEGNGKKLTQKQKDKITKLVQIAVMDDDYYWGDEDEDKDESGEK